MNHSKLQSRNNFSERSWISAAFIFDHTMGTPRSKVSRVEREVLLSTCSRIKKTFCVFFFLKQERCVRRSVWRGLCDGEVSDICGEAADALPFRIGRGRHPLKVEVGENKQCRSITTSYTTATVFGQRLAAEYAKESQEIHKRSEGFYAF